jgi:hypothetical protein
MCVKGVVEIDMYDLGYGDGYTDGLDGRQFEPAHPTDEVYMEGYNDGLDEAASVLEEEEEFDSGPKHFDDHGYGR